MTKAIGVTIGVIVVAALALAIIPTTRDEIHWQWASRKDETASYKSYVNAWPTGRHAREGKTRYDEHGWAEASTANTVQGFERYVQLHPDSKHVAEAKDSIESLHWQEATTANTVQGFERYEQLYPEGLHLAEARGRIDTLHWQEADGKGTIRALRSYLSTHPGGLHTADAETMQNRLRKDDSLFSKARRYCTPEALRQFLDDFPGHNREADAISALSSLEKVARERDSQRGVALEARGLFDIYYPHTTYQNERLKEEGLVVFPFHEVRFLVAEKDRSKLDEVRGHTQVAQGHTLYDMTSCDAVLYTRSGQSLFLRELQLSAENTVRPGWRASGRLYRHTSTRLPLRAADGNLSNLSMARDSVTAFYPSEHYWQRKKITYVTRSGEELSRTLDLEVVMKSDEKTYLADEGILGRVSTYVYAFVNMRDIAIVEFRR